MAVATGLFPVYGASRRTLTKLTLLANLDACLAEVDLAEPRRTEVGAAWRTAVAAVEPPWLPTSLEDVGTAALAGWGRTPVRRSCVRLLHLIGEAERSGVATPEELAAWRRRVNQAIELMGAPTLPTDRSTNLFRTVTQWDAAGDTPVAEHVGARLTELVGTWADERKVVGRQLRLLGGVACRVCRVLGLVPGAPPSGPVGVRLLLAMEVIETSFGGYANLVEQPVESLRIDSLATSPLDPLRRDRAAGKVAGVQLAHFGSFLKASWRANDWMWGRLDGSADLIEVLLQPVPTERLRALWTLHHPAVDGGPARAAPSDDALRREVRDVLVRCRHADIVLEETPTVVAGIERDRDAGGQTSASAKALERAWAEMTTLPEAPEDRQRAAEKLLGLNRVGAESLADQAGGDLLTRTAVTTLATATTVLNESTPKALNGALATIRFFALVLWGFGKGAMGGKYTRTLAGLMYGIGATVVVVELLPGVTTGAVLPFGLALLIAGTVLGFLRAPFIVVPTLVFIAVPLLLREMPVADHRWSWWPDGWAFPTLRGRLPWVPPVAALVGVIVIGVVRRPVWFRSITVDHRAFDARLTRLTRPTRLGAAATSDGAVAVARGSVWRWHVALWTLLVVAPAVKTAQVLTTRAVWAEVGVVVAVVLIVAVAAWFAIDVRTSVGRSPSAEPAMTRWRRFGDAVGVSWVRAELSAPWQLAAGLSVASLAVALVAWCLVARWVLVGVVGVLLVWMLVGHARRTRAEPPLPGRLASLSRPWWIVPLALAGLGVGIALGAGAEGVDLWPRRGLELLFLTVVAEELIFRGCLFALAHRVLSAQWASFVTAVSFGLWHVGDVWNAADLDSAGQRTVRLVAVVLAWVLAGLALGFLRRRSRTLEGPLAGHLAVRVPAAVLRAF